jgi:hypothetical protein
VLFLDSRAIFAILVTLLFFGCTIPVPGGVPQKTNQTWQTNGTPVVVLENTSVIHQNATNATQEKPPAAKPSRNYSSFKAYLSPGETYDFMVGAIKLDQIAFSGKTLPADISIFYPDGRLYKSARLLPGLDSTYVSPAGKTYHVYLAWTEMGATKGLARAKIVVLEDRELGGIFDPNDYADAIGETPDGQFPENSIIGKYFTSGILDRNDSLDARYFSIKLEDAGLSDPSSQAALLSILDPYGKFTENVRLAAGSAYVLQDDFGVNYAILNRGAFAGKSGNSFADIYVYDAPATLSPGGTYMVALTSFAREKSPLATRSILVGYTEPFAMGFDLSVDDYGLSGIGNSSFALVSERGLNNSILKRGIALRDSPFIAYSTYGVDYAIFLDALDNSTGKLKANLSVYKK